MKKFRFLLAGLMTAGVMTLAGCGGGGSNRGDEPTVAATTFNMVALAGFDNSNFAAGVAINDEGLAVGFSDNGTSIQGAKWTVTDALPTTTDLHPTVLPPLDNNTYSAAYGVNADGIAVGESGMAILSVLDANTVAVYWPADENPTPEILQAVNPENWTSTAYSINSKREIVGEAVDDEAGNTVAVYWGSPDATPTRLAHLTNGGFSSAYFIGNDGRIVGESRNSVGKAQAVVWTPTVTLPANTITYGAPLPLVTVDGASSVALGVDSLGRIVGEVESAIGEVQGVVWSANNGSVAKSLGSNTSVQAINDANRMVGYSAALSGSDISSIWSVANILDTKSPAVAFSQAYGINAGNQVVGVRGNQAFAALPQ